MAVYGQAGIAQGLVHAQGGEGHGPPQAHAFPLPDQRHGRIPGRLRRRGEMGGIAPLFQGLTQPGKIITKH